MNLCAFCGYPTLDDGMCAYHGLGQGTRDGDDWASSNRTMCDFIHRGIVLDTRFVHRTRQTG